MLRKNSTRRGALGWSLGLLLIVGNATAQTLDCGDCDASGSASITILDALAAAQIAAGISSADPTRTCACDVNGTGAVQILDALLIAQEAAGLPVSLACAAPVCGLAAITPIACGGLTMGTISGSDPGVDLGAAAYTAVFELAALAPGTQALTIELTAGTGDLDLYVGAPGTMAGDPSPASFAFVSTTPGSSLESVVIDAATVPALAAYAGQPIAIAVHAAMAGDFTLSVTCATTVPVAPTFTPLPSGPSARVFARGVLDDLRQRVIIFGGYAGSLLNDTWAFDLNTDTWNQLSPTGPLPGGSDGVQMVYDLWNDRVVFFGGSGTWTETWELEFSISSDGAWHQLSPAGVAPAGRVYGGAIFDPFDRRMLMYGGGGSFFAELWELSLSSPGSEAWTQLTPAGLPLVGLSDHSVVYDENRHRMLIYAGSQGGMGVVNSVYEIDLTTGPAGTFTQLAPAPAGLARWHQAAIFDPVGGRLIAHGGIEPSFSPPHYDDVAQLSFAGATPVWQDVTPVTRPGGRYGHVLVADPARRRAILFGGTAGSYGPMVLNDTWAMHY